MLFVDWCGVLYRGCRLEWTAVSTTFFEDPNSLNKAPCPSIYDPAEKYNSLIIPAYNEEHRLPEALTETLKKQRSWRQQPESIPPVVLELDDDKKKPDNAAGWQCNCCLGKRRSWRQQPESIPPVVLALDDDKKKPDNAAGWQCWDCAARGKAEDREGELENEKSVLMGTASNQDNQDGALEITVSGEK
ncbi:hypothetical protein ABZP36_016549 [Zizania latifolia]